LQIRTFHSWFAQLTRAAPLRVRHELGLPASYELLEDDSQIIEAVWPRFWACVQAAPELTQALGESIAAHGRSNTIKSLEAALDKRAEFAAADVAGVLEGSVLSFGEQYSEFAKLDHPDDLLAQPASQTLLRNAAVAMGQGGGKSKTLIADAGKLEQLCTEGRWVDAVEVLLTKEGELHKKPPKGDMSLEQQQTVQVAREMCHSVVKARIQHAAWQHQQRMVLLSRALLAEFAQTKRERGWVDMGDIEQVAHRLLSDETMGAWLQEVLDWRVRHLLVDEFQDTNPLQWQVLHGWLQSYAGSASDAPSIFIVGDPKQSIYRFRRADPQVFVAARDFVRQGLQGHWLACEHTRRNAQAIIGLTNAVMRQAKDEQLMPGFRTHTTESEAQGEVLALPLVTIEAASKQAATAGAAPWRDSLTQAREQTQEHVRQLEARQVALWIAARLKAGEKPTDFMVLARKNERLARMAQELRSLGIACERADQESLFDAPEVQDMVALLECLLQPMNDLALARALKSPVFGLDDVALMQIATQVRKNPATPRMSWREALRQAGLCNTQGQPIAAVLDHWQGWLSQWPVHDALSLMMDEAQVLERYARAVPAALQGRVQASLKALLTASLSVGGGRFVSAREFVRSLKAGRVKAAGVEAGDGVKLLTIHKAKGLEASNVVMLDTQPAADRGKHMGILFKWPAHQDKPQAFAFVTSQSKPTENLRKLVEEEQADDDREDMHCLYVAMTRAKQRLVVSASQGAKSGAEGNWYERLVQTGLLAGVEVVQPIDPVANATPMPLRLAQLPAWQGQGMGHSVRQVLRPIVPTPAALTEPALAAIQDQTASPEPGADIAARTGLALHRLLQSVPLLDVSAAAQASWQFDPSQLDGVRQEFGLDAAQAAQVANAASHIVRSQPWLWDAARVIWQANEMALWSGAEVLRLDRVVRVASKGGEAAWWVIDYKSASRPLENPELLAQLRAYQSALEAALGQSVLGKVRAAFVTAQGDLFEMPEQNTV
jgi:ATP-dependent helicase/nuclease subunit A